MVLAALLLWPGQVVGVDQLVELVGGSRNALQTTVGRLREVLGDLVLTRPGGYLIDVRPNEVDLHLFSHAEALVWLETERLNLKAAVYLAAYQGHYQHAWQLPHHLSYFLLLRGYGRERVEVQSVALAAAHQLGDLKARAEALKGLGSAYMSDGNPKAEEHLHEALDLTRQIGDLRSEASTMGLLGIMARDRRQLDKAMEYFERGLVLMRHVGAKTGEANALHNIGIVYDERGDTDAALAHIEEALVLLKAHGDVRSCAMAMHDLSYVHYHALRDVESMSYMDQTVRAYRESGDWRGEMLSLADFGRMLHAMGEHDRARAMVSEVVSRTMEHMGLSDPETALVSMAEVKDTIGQIKMLTSLALTAEYDGRLTEAVRYAELARQPRAKTIAREALARAKGSAAPRS